jgi:hypothetical protein
MAVLLAIMPRGHAIETNHDEAAVLAYTLPDVLAGPDGKPAATVEWWRTVSRPHQLGLLEKNVYGRRLPAVPVRVVGDVERAEVTLAGHVPAKRLQARLRLGEAADAKVVEVLVYLPVAQKPVPVFVELNFAGNHAQHPDPAIRLSQAWMRDDKEGGIVANRATEASRGRCAQRFPVEQMLARGSGMATAYYGDIFPDRPVDAHVTLAMTAPRPLYVASAVEDAWADPRGEFLAAVADRTLRGRASPDGR